MTTHKIVMAENGYRKNKSLKYKKLKYRPQKLETTKLINCFAYCQVKHSNHLHKIIFTIRSWAIAAVHLINI